MNPCWNKIDAEGADRLLTDVPVVQVEFHTSLGSTNDRALQLAQSTPEPFPQIVVAGEQTSGRGQRTNRWYSSTGSLTFSLICNLQDFGLGTANLPQLSLAAALGVRAGILETQPQSRDCLQLKWPNDVFLNSQKLAGLLLEPVPLNSNLLVIGVGVNVNDPMDSAPSEIKPLATSLLATTAERTDLVALLGAIARQMLDHFQQLAEDQSTLLQHWSAHCFLTGRQVALEIGKQRIRGVCQGIAHDGALVIKNEDGRQTFYAGRVQLT